MTPWSELRAWLDEEAQATVDLPREALQKCLARLDAAELALDEARTRSDEGESCAAYDALVREQDGGK